MDSRIGLNKLQAPFIGPKSVECAQMAMKAGCEKSLRFYSVWQFAILYAGHLWRIKNHGAGILQKSRKNNGTKPGADQGRLELPEPAYPDCSGLPGIETWPSAKVYFEKILKIEPDYLWVKNDLYPAFLKKIKEQR